MGGYVCVCLYTLETQIIIQKKSINIDATDVSSVFTVLFSHQVEVVICQIKQTLSLDTAAAFVFAWQQMAH